MATREYRVYVIRLDPKVLDKPPFRKANPNHDPRKPCVYVGSSSLPPEVRFLQHKNGVKKGRYTLEFGIELLKSAMKSLKPASTALAGVRNEAKRARGLRRAGYAVWPTDEALRGEIKKLHAKQLERLAARARKARQRRREKAAAQRAAQRAKAPLVVDARETATPARC